MIKALPNTSLSLPNYVKCHQWFKSTHQPAPLTQLDHIYKYEQGFDIGLCIALLVSYFLFQIPELCKTTFFIFDF